MRISVSSQPHTNTKFRPKAEPERCIHESGLEARILYAYALMPHFGRMHFFLDCNERPPGETFLSSRRRTRIQDPAKAGAEPTRCMRGCIDRKCIILHANVLTFSVISFCPNLRVCIFLLACSKEKQEEHQPSIQFHTTSARPEISTGNTFGPALKPHYWVQREGRGGEGQIYIYTD